MPLGSYLNGGTISQLRGLAWLSMTDAGQVMRGTVVSDGGGGGTTSWAGGGTVPCRIDPIRPREDMAGERLSELSTHRVRTPPGTVVTHNDLFVIAGRGTFEVLSVDGRTDEPLTTFEVIATS